MEYLEKYNKKIPTTWDELIDTGKYILKEEKKLNNTDLLGYNGIFSGKFLKITLYSFIFNKIFI